MTNDALLEAFRHNGWATKELLASCRVLSQEQLNAPGNGSFGSILDTFNHLVLSDARYLLRLAGGGSRWVVDQVPSTDLDQLESRADETAELWERFLSEPVEVERAIIVDAGTREVRAGIYMAQALHHGNAHREQICASMTNFGIEPPDIQAWGYAWATGGIWDRPGNHARQK